MIGPIQSGRLVEPVILAREHPVFVASLASHPIHLRGPRASGLLRREHLSPPEPPVMQIEEMHRVLDEDASALRRVPEPVPGRQLLVSGVVLEEGVARLAQQLLLHHGRDHFQERAVAQHVIHHQEPPGRLRRARTASSACAAVSASGFSHSTCFPASSARRVNS